MSGRSTCSTLQKWSMLFYRFLSACGRADSLNSTIVRILSSASGIASTFAFRAGGKSGYRIDDSDTGFLLSMGLTLSNTLSRLSFIHSLLWSAMSAIAWRSGSWTGLARSSFLPGLPRNVIERIPFHMERVRPNFYHAGGDLHYSGGSCACGVSGQIRLRPVSALGKACLAYVSRNRHLTYESSPMRWSQEANG